MSSGTGRRQDTRPDLDPASYSNPSSPAGVNDEYLYSSIDFHGAGDSAVGLIEVDDPAKAHDDLEREWMRLHGEELYTSWRAPHDAGKSTGEAVSIYAMSAPRSSSLKYQ